MEYIWRIEIPVTNVAPKMFRHVISILSLRKNLQIEPSSGSESNTYCTTTSVSVLTDFAYINNIWPLLLFYSLFTFNAYS